MTRTDRIRTAAPVAPDALDIELASGKTYRVSIAEPMSRIAGFAPLKNAGEFATVKVSEFGWSVEWGCGLSMSSERLYQMGKEQAGEAFPLADFKAWMERNGLSLTTAAQALSLTRRTVSQYSSGARLVPVYIGLACIGWETLQKQKAA